MEHDDIDSNYGDILEELDEIKNEYDTDSTEDRAANLAYTVLEKILGNQAGGLINERRYLEKLTNFTQEIEKQTELSVEDRIDYDNVIDIGMEELENEDSILDFNTIEEGVVESNTISGKTEYDETYEDILKNVSQVGKKDDLRTTVNIIDNSIDRIIGNLSEDGDYNATTIIDSIELMESDEFENIYKETVGTALFTYSLNEEIAETIEENIKNIPKGTEIPEPPQPNPPEPPTEDPENNKIAEAFRRFVDEYTERHDRISERRETLRNRTGDTSDIEEAERKIDQI